jgi:lysine 2,3-aminomutase
MGKRFSRRRAGENLFGHISRDEWNDWRWQLRHRIRTFEQMKELFGLPESNRGAYEELINTYHMSVTPYYLSLMNQSDVADPLRLQCIPDMRELQASSRYVDDPLLEEQTMPVPDLIHRYPDRCLAMVTSACALYCRHCNRKRRWRNPEKFVSRDGLLRMARYIESRETIREVIISGGDPLMMNLNRLEWFLRTIRAIDHVEILRIGTRIPVVLPMRITGDLCALFKKYRPLWIVTQFNHPGEITTEAARACEMLLEHGLPVCNQSVLLRGINDSHAVMKDLLYGLQRISVKPYYLFHCEPVRGTEHFHVDVETGRRIMDDLWGDVSGLCIPRYVYDLPGGGGKVPLETFPSRKGGFTEHLT